MIKRNELPLGIRKQFEYDENEKLKMMADFQDDMEKGLNGEPEGLPMLPAFTDIPRGNEEGEFLVIDLGGTNLRVMSVELKNGKAEIIEKNNNTIAGEIATGTSDEFFDYIASRLKDFVDKSNGGKMHLGFTFSHAIEQTGLDSGKIAFFSKGYDIPDAIGKDPVVELQKSLSRLGVNNIEINALSNDTVGALANGAYADENCDIAIILGTGTNAAYREKTENIKKQALDEIADHMIINTEWCDFTRLPQNKYDKKVDTEMGGGALEKQVAGKYLGAILHQLACDLAQESVLSSDFAKRILEEKDREVFSSEFISIVLGDQSEDLKDMQKTLEELGFEDSIINDRKIIKEASEMIIDRSIMIVALATAALIRKMDPELTNEHSIAVDGSLYEKIPDYKEKLESEIEKILSKKIKTFLSKDGSGIGAAILAARNVQV